MLLRLFGGQTQPINNYAMVRQNHTQINCANSQVFARNQMFIWTSNPVGGGGVIGGTLEINKIHYLILVFLKTAKGGGLSLIMVLRIL